MAIVQKYGVLVPSRNGSALEIPMPVVTSFSHPQERVLFHTKRRINPYLHFFEPFWILAGRDDVKFLSDIVKRFDSFSDDGVTLYGAYGARIMPQVEWAIKRLRNDPFDRRTVLQIRRPEDISYNGKDMPCNTSVALKIRNGRLNMHVFNRSNDVIWGGPAGGSNHPQFTVLQEYIAGKIGCSMGYYWVTTDSLHAYQNDQWNLLKDVGQDIDYYQTGQAIPFHLSSGSEMFDSDLKIAFEAPNDLEYETVYFRHVYAPMWASFRAYKQKAYKEAKRWAGNIMAADWRIVTEAWLEDFIDEEPK